MSISPDFISGPENGSSKEKSVPGISFSDKLFDLPDYLSQTLFKSWEKRPVTSKSNQNSDRDLTSQDLLLGDESGRREKYQKC